MKLLIVSQYFWPENFRINDIARSLVRMGVEVEVLTGKPNYPEGKIYAGHKAWGIQIDEEFGLIINRLPLLPRGSGALRLAINYLSFIFSGIFLAPWIFRKKKFDIIFSNGLSPILSAIIAILIGRLKGCPVVIWVQDLWPESLSATGYLHNRFAIKFVEYIVRFIYRHADLLLVQSRAFCEPVGLLAPGKRVIYFPNSVDSSFLASTSENAPNLFGLENKFTVLFAGNIGAAQGVEVIVEAAALLKKYSDIHFIILGDGSRREWMLQEMQSRNLSNLHLPGRFPVESMPGFMQKASSLLVTLADREIFAATVPNKIQAYMAAGRPIISCLNGEGSRLVLESGAGLVASAEDSSALADAVLKLYGMPASEREYMGNKGRIYFQAHFDHDRLVGQLIDYFSDLSKRGDKVQ